MRQNPQSKATKKVHKKAQKKKLGPAFWNKKINK